ncbi:helix-turn-helix domain-containing protein [Streptacidiphilus melanogenes]|uniref:helix-turn-helix domain-containing protein n=1 Tax=Streptacidiphilus melanogenes TaxID=411235 RepID=UPI0005A5F631|nr:pyridoxamine 5'-phosphate oxidase family protein [Streptacidiphilus melanogenes]
MFAAWASAGPADASRQPAERRHAGDLGRRVSHRRQELGLSVAEVARRAGMTPGFVDWIETRPAEIGPGELARIAAALDTTRRELLGADHDAAPGRAGPDRRAVSVALTEDECRSRLGRRGIGRIAFDPGEKAGGELVVRPVNYEVVDGVVLFRTEEAGALSGVVGRPVVLEVDRLDDVLALGWSLLVTGLAEADPREEDRVGADEEGPLPWAAGPRDLLVRIRPDRITGRELRPATDSAAPTEDSQ